MSTSTIIPHRNIVEGYKRFEATSRYLAQRLEATKRFRLLYELAANEEVSSTQLESWVELTQRVPLLFLELIGAESPIIRSCLQQDRNSFDLLCEREHFVRFVTVRYMATIYRSIVLPFEMSETMAIRYTNEHLSQGRFRCCIPFEGFKAIFIEPDGSIDTLYYPPSLTFGETELIPSCDGSEEGTSDAGGVL